MAKKKLARFGELSEAKKKLKIHKASGSENIHQEMVKYIGAEGKNWQLNILREQGNKRKIPEEWKVNESQSSVAFKLYTRIVHNRLRNIVDSRMKEKQAALGKGRRKEIHSQQRTYLKKK